jgi:hypothetical protein
MAPPVEQQAPTFAAAAAEFAEAWANPRFTAIEREPVDVNQILREQYTLARELTFTRTMMWDNEVKKARDPVNYIPSAVLDGRIWARHAEAGEERFLRATQQRQWLTGQQGLILERVHLSDAEQRAIFLGTPELRDAGGAPLSASRDQPLFHVEHGVGGAEDRPLNLWRIVYLTDSPDDRFVRLFGATRPRLPEYIEQYIQRDLGIGLTFRTSSKPAPDGA